MCVQDRVSYCVRERETGSRLSEETTTPYVTCEFRKRKDGNWLPFVQVVGRSRSVGKRMNALAKVVPRA